MCAFKDSAKIVGVEWTYFVGDIEIDGWIFLGYHIHGTPQRTSTKFIGDNAFVNLNAFYHVNRNIVECNEVADLS